MDAPAGLASAGPLTRLRGRVQQTSFRQRLIFLSAAAVAVAVVLASVAAYVVVRNQLRDDVDNRLQSLYEQIAIPRGLLLPGAPAGDDFLVASHRPARKPRRVCPGGAPRRFGDPSAGSARSSCR